LYGVPFYGLHQLIGIPGLIVINALLVVGLALVLVRLGRIGPGLWLPALMAAIAILTASPRLYLQPIIVSWLFLGLTLYFLQRGGQWLYRGGEPEAREVTWKDYWPILPLFLAWVNLDEWFFLGPVTVAIYAAGQAVERGAGRQARPGEARAL